MAEIKLDADTLRMIALFEKVTGARVRDVLEEEDRNVFVVDEDELGKAIGKGASNLKRLRDLLQKDVEMVGYSEDPEKFVRNIFHRYQVKQVRLEERDDKGGLMRIEVDPQEKGRVIGRGGRNVGMARQLVGRHHGVKDIIVE